MGKTGKEPKKKKRKEKSQYFLTILFTLIALAGMVVYNFVTFYSNAVSDMIAVGESSLSQESDKGDGCPAGDGDRSGVYDAGRSGYGRDRSISCGGVRTL